MVRKYRNKNNGIDLNGIILLDKPTGLSSNQALQNVKHLFNAQKAGHTGSLDPLASGMLAICFGKATKISQYLLESRKSYQFTVKLGEMTETGDSEGAVLETKTVNIDDKESAINLIESTFSGELEQIPPMYSALHHNGERLYNLARQGITVEREARKITIDMIKVLQFEDNLIDVEVLCSKGTYVRTLAEDIGKLLNFGGHVINLRRLFIEPFKQESMVTMENLELIAQQSPEHIQSCLLPIDTALFNWPGITLTSDLSYYLKLGQAVFVPNVENHPLIRLYDENENFIGVGHMRNDGKIAPKKLMNV